MWMRMQGLIQDFGDGDDGGIYKLLLGWSPMNGWQVKDT